MLRLKCVKALVVSVLALLVALPASAQAHYVPHISVGVRGGVTMAKQDISPSVPQGWKLGSTGAVQIRYAEERHVGVIAELGWVQRGWKEDFEESPLQYSRTLTFINLPILTHISFGGKRFKAIINLGPEFCYMIGESKSANFDYNNLESVTDWPERQRHTEQLAMDVKNKFDYGITAGVGCEYYLSPRRSITLEARYYFGLGNVFPSSKADTFSASRSTSIEISVGYNFRLQ